MCVVSLVMDHYQDRWTQRISQPFEYVPLTSVNPPMQTIIVQPTISADEVAEFKRLLERAREYDKRMGEPDCELNSKRQALKKLAEQLGVEISFL